MLRELRKIRKDATGQYQYIWRLMKQGKLTRHVSNGGYLAYDTEELRRVKKELKQGRPLKGE